MGDQNQKPVDPMAPATPSTDGNAPVVTPTTPPAGEPGAWTPPTTPPAGEVKPGEESPTGGTPPTIPAA